MIRPLTDEEELQNLEHIDMKDLRPDFFEQVLDLRRKVLHRVKPKTIDGKQLSPTMF
jgi:hypothetical protein